MACNKLLLPCNGRNIDPFRRLGQSSNSWLWESPTRTQKRFKSDSDRVQGWRFRAYIVVLKLSFDRQLLHIEFGKHFGCQQLHYIFKNKFPGSFGRSRRPCMVSEHHLLLGNLNAIIPLGLWCGLTTSSSLDSCSAPVQCVCGPLFHSDPGMIRKSRIHGMSWHRGLWSPM